MEGLQGEVLCERGFVDATGAAQKDVLTAPDEVG